MCVLEESNPGTESKIIEIQQEKLEELEKQIDELEKKNEKSAPIS